MIAPAILVSTSSMRTRLPSILISLSLLATRKNVVNLHIHLNLPNDPTVDRGVAIPESRPRSFSRMQRIRQAHASLRYSAMPDPPQWWGGATQLLLASAEVPVASSECRMTSESGELGKQH